MVRKNGSDKFLVCGDFSIADIALGAMLGSMNMVEMKFGIVQFRDKYPELRKYWEMLEGRASFMKTQPEMFALTEKVV